MHHTIALHGLTRFHIATEHIPEHKGPCPIFFIMRRGKNKKQLQEQLESPQKRLEEKTAECGQYVTTIAELNKKNFEV